VRAIRKIAEIRTLLSVSHYDEGRLQYLTDTIAQFSAAAHVSDIRWNHADSIDLR
jgi:hypothetical protein